MDRRWVSNFAQDINEQNRFEQYLRNSRGVLDRLLEILSQMETELDSRELGKDIYDTPSWAYQEADTIGSRRMLRSIIRLITLDQEDTNGRQPI